ncbi:MAG: Zn-dependent hydrolase [Bacteroidales bacterium]|nr:Zn-dependent hydrolase [Bacteroidales bacterium]
MNRPIISFLAAVVFILFANAGYADGKKASKLSPQDSIMKAKVSEFVMVKLKSDLTKLSDKEKKMIPILIDVGKIMDDLYWQQVIMEKKKFMDSISDPFVKRFADINYGPWERLNNNQPFVKGYGKKPAGANFYPRNMTKVEFEKWNNKDKTSQYSIIRRKSDKTLENISYHEAYKSELTRASILLNQAAALAEDPGLKKYLQLRSNALITDDYFESDMAWMDMKDNTIDFVVGPIENYEDGLYGYKTAYESSLLIKDKEWSQKLAKFAKLLPELQQQLPVADSYKSEKPGTDSDLNAYDIIYCSGHSNAGSKTIAINLPNDEKVQLAKGSRRLQLKNAMQAKFDNILVPISRMLIDSSQKRNIKFDAFFSNVMFHEVAHGLGIKNTVNGKGTVRDALKEKYSAFEEAKADILGLFLVAKLIEKGEIKDITVEDCFVTYMAGLIRSVRFGAASAHGMANMMCFNYFAEKGAFERSPQGIYKVNFAKIATAMNEWSAKILTFEGNGDYQGASAYLISNGVIHETLKKDLDRLKTAHIPIDIVYSQGVGYLGLK